MFIPKRLFSKFKLNPSDLIEKFTSGSGPGGQKVNKSTNCVFLKHELTGHSVKVHDSRDLNVNRKIAVKRLTDKIEFQEFGAESKIGRRIEKVKRNKDRLRRRRENRLKDSD